jgi:integrase/recombinase XerD
MSFKRLPPAEPKSRLNTHFNPMPHVSPLIKRYVAYLDIERGLSSNTLLSYKTDLLRLQTWASQNVLILRGLTSHDISRHIASLSKANLNPVSINRAITTIRTFYEFLFLENEIPSNPAIDIPSLKKSRPLPHVLTPDEARRLLDVPNTSQLTGLRDRALLEILLAAGLRISEAINLRICDLALERRLLRCLGKGRKERQVPFTAEAAEWLTRYIRMQHPQRRPTTSQVFLNQGQPLTRQFAWSLITDYAGVAQIRVTPHSLRHTFATSLLNNGVPTEIVQQLLGHSSVSVTEIYLSVSTSRIRDSYDRHHPRARSRRLA